MISVWPMAMVPTTMTCCRIREKFCSERNRSLCAAKKAQARTRAIDGPECAHGWQLVQQGFHGTRRRFRA